MFEGDGVSHVDPTNGGGGIQPEASYVAVSAPKAADLKKYYEKVGDDYIPTEDTKVVSGKTYYMLDNNVDMGTVNDAFQADGTAALGNADIPVITGDDTARAYVATGSEVVAHNITIHAESKLLLDLMAFTASGGVMAGVSTTIAVGITHANAVAYAETGTTLTATGDVNITAWTGSEKVAAPEGSDEAKRNAAFNEQIKSDSSEKSDDKLGNLGAVFSGRSVRVVGAAGSLGTIGISPCVAVLVLDSNAYAYLAGNVTKAVNVTVKAETRFPTAAAATFGLAVGGGAVSASVAVVVSNGVAYAGIVGLADVKNVTGTVTVHTDADFDATTFAASIAAGQYSVNGAVSVAVDHMTVHTFVGQAATLDNVNSLVVTSGGTVTAHANIIGGAIGMLAVGAGVAVATIDPTILTYVGTTPLVAGKVTKAIAGASGTNKQAHVGSLTIGNSVTTKGQALTLGISIGEISIGTNVLVVSNDSLLRAGIFQKNVIVDGFAAIDSAFSAKADTECFGIDVGLIAVGVNVFVSNLTADNSAIVDPTGTEVSVGSLGVYAGRETNPNISTANAIGIGSANGLIAVAVNVAYAENSTVNNAKVLGTGTLTVHGALNVEANGRASAYAVMGSGIVQVSGAKISSNNAFAYVNAEQIASIENANIVTNGGAVKVASNFNLPNSNGSCGAVSLIGVNGPDCNGDGEPINGDGDLIDVSLLSITVSVGKARMDATVRAIVTGATLDTCGDNGRGAVSVSTNADSYAKADTIVPLVTVTLIKVGVTDVRASARGTFEAILDVVGKDNKVGVTSITTNYDSHSFAGNGPLGGVEVSALSVNVNVARSKTATVANAGLTGSGKLDVAGDLSITTTGSSKAEAEGRTYKVTISAIKVLVNSIISTQSVNQSAFSTFAGELNTNDGKLSVFSELGKSNDRIDTTSTVGSSAGAGSKDVSITLAGEITVNTAKANSTSTNMAYVTGAGSTSTTYNVGSASVKAKTYANSTATAKSAFGITLGWICGDLLAEASSSDFVDASVGGLTLNATNDVDIEGYAIASVNGEIVDPGGIGSINVKSMEAYANLGTSDCAQTANASVGKNAVINSTKGNINVKAENYGNAEGKVKGGSSFSLITTTVDVFFTSTVNFATNATIGDAAKLNAAKDITVKAISKPETVSNAKSSALSLTVSVDKTYSNAVTTTTTNASIGTGAEIIAGKAIEISARGNVKQETISSSDAKGVWSGKGSIKAKNTVNRTVAATVGAGAKIIAKGEGLIAIKSIAGDDDCITNQSLVTSGALVGTSTVRTEARINSSATTTVGAGATIENTFGKINIAADSSMRYFYNNASSDARGLGADPDSETDTQISMYGNVNVGDAAGAKANIVGRYVTLESYSSTVKVIDRTYAYGAGVGAGVRAYTSLLAHIDNATTVTNAIIRGYDTVAVRSISAPKIAKDGAGSSNQNVLANSNTVIYAAGEGRSHAYMNKDVTSFTTNVNLTDATILGADIDIISRNSLRYKPSSDGYASSFFAKVYHYTSKPKNVAANISQGSGNAYYVGDAAAGIVIDIAGTDADPEIRAVGLRGERKIWNRVDDTIVFGNISNPLKGTLDMTRELYGMHTNEAVAGSVFDQNMIPYVRIFNHTNLDVQLSAITTENANYLKPKVNGTSYNAIKTGVAGGENNGPVRPEITVTTYTGANVIINGLIPNQTGSVSFVWADEKNPGSLLAAKDSVSTANLGFPVAPIWAHKFTVKGAKDVTGSYETENGEHARLSLYLSTLDGEAPINSINAFNDIWLIVTDILLVEGDAAAAAPRDSEVIVGNIVGGNVTNVVIDTAMTIYRQPGTQVISMPTPGTLEYATDVLVALNSQVTLDYETMKTYLVSETEDDRTFLLPNGAVIHTDADGVVVRVIEGGIDVTFSDYAISVVDNHLVATLGPGVTIDLDTGIITVAEDSSLDILMSSISGAWLKSFVLTNSPDHKIVVYDTSGGKTTEVELTASKLLTISNGESAGIEIYELVGQGRTYMFGAAFGKSSPNSLSYALGRNASKLKQWIADEGLSASRLLEIVDILLTDEDYDGHLVPSETTTATSVVDILPDWSGFNEWLLGKLNDSDNASILDEIDDYGKFSHYIKEEMTDKDYKALADYLKRHVEGDEPFDQRLMEFVASLVWPEEYSSNEQFVAIVLEKIQNGPTVELAQWITGRIAYGTLEFDARIADADSRYSFLLSTQLEDSSFTGRQAWEWMIDELGSEDAFAYLDMLFTDDDYETIVVKGGYGLPADAPLEREGGVSAETRLAIAKEIIARDSFGEWLLDRLSKVDEAKIVELDQYGDKLSYYLNDFMDEMSCIELLDWIDKQGGNGRLDRAALRQLVASLFERDEYTDSDDLDAKVDALIDGDANELARFIAERLLLPENEDKLIQADYDFSSLSILVSEGNADAVGAWALDNIYTSDLEQIVVSLLTHDDLKVALYPTAGFSPDGKTITNETLLSMWLFTRLKAGTVEAQTAIAELERTTTVESQNCVYLIAYDPNTDVVATYQIGAALPSSGSVTDFLNTSVADDMKGDAWSEIWGANFIGYLLKRGAKGDVDSNGYQRYGRPDTMVANLLLTPDTIEIGNFLGSISTVKAKVTLAREGVYVTYSDSLRENIITGVSSYTDSETGVYYSGYYMDVDKAFDSLGGIISITMQEGVNLSAIMRDATTGYVYLDWEVAQGSYEYQNYPDVKYLYDYLRDVIWTETPKNELTAFTVRGKNGNGDNPKVDTTWSVEQGVPFAYCVGTKKGSSNLYKKVFIHPYVHTLELNYIKLVPTDAILSQSFVKNGDVVSVINKLTLNQLGSDISSTNATESKVTIIGAIGDIPVKTIELPKDTAWANETSSERIGYRITESLYIAIDGTYYFREPTDLEGFVRWFDTKFGAVDFTTAEWDSSFVALLKAYIDSSLLSGVDDENSSFWTTKIGDDANTTLSVQLFAINMALLEDEYADTKPRAQAALNALNDAANYPQWLSRQMANAMTDAQKEKANLAFKALAAIGGIEEENLKKYIAVGSPMQAWYRPADNPETFTFTVYNEDTNANDVSMIITTPARTRANDNASTITLEPGTKVYLEVLTPDVARSADGRYFVMPAGSLDYVAVKGNPEENIVHGIATSKLDDGTVIEGKLLDDGTILPARTETFNVIHEGTTYLTVTRYLVGNELVFLEYTMGAAPYTGTMADSDGNVVPGEGVEWDAVSNFGSTYKLSNIVGKSTTVTVNDPGYVDSEKLFHPAHVINGDPTPAIVGDEILIITAVGTDIGENGDGLATAPYTEGTDVEVHFETLEGAPDIITGEVWLSTDGSVRLPDGLIVTQGAEYHHDASIDIIYNTIDVAKKGKLELIAQRNVLGVPSVDADDNVIESYVKVGESAEATLSAGNLNSFNYIQGGDDSTINVIGTGSIVGELLTSDTNANFTLTSDGNINSADHYLVVDLPGSNALNIAHANDYYLVGIEAVNAQDATGRDEDGNIHTGTDMGSLPGETVTAGIVSSDSAELAAWILARIEGRDDLVAQLDAAAADPCDALVAAGDAVGFAEWLARQIEQGLIDDAAIAALVSELITDEDIATLVAEMTAAKLAESENQTELTEEETAAIVEAAREAYAESTLTDTDNLAAWLVAHLAKNAEAVAELDEAVAEKVDDIIASGDAAALAAWLDSQKAQGKVDDALLATIVSELITAEDLEALEQDAWSNTTYPEADPSRVEDLRNLAVLVGESTGSAYVDNLGDILIVQRTGTMTAGNVVSQLGDVTLVNEDGSIAGDASEIVNVQGSNIDLEASGNIGPIVIETGVVNDTVVGTIENVTSGATPKVAFDEESGQFTTTWDVSYEQVANYDKRETGKLDAMSGGNVDITEKSGNLGVDIVEADGTVALTAASLTDVRADGETDPNIVAEGVTIIATNGSIGTADEPLEIDTNGEGSSAEATVNAVAREDVNLTEVDGDMRVGAITAGGEANLVVENGSLTDADTDDVVSKLAELLAEARVAAEQSESAAESARLREAALQDLLDAYVAAQEARDEAEKALDDAQQAADIAALDASNRDAEASAAEKRAQDLKDAEQALADAIEEGDADKIAAAQDALDAVKQQIADELGFAVDQVTVGLLDDLAKAARDIADEVQRANEEAQQELADAQQELSDAKDAENDAKDAYWEFEAEVEAYRQVAEDKAAVAEAAAAAAAELQRKLDELEAARDEAQAAQQAANEANDALDELKQQIADELGIDPDDVTDELLAQRAAEEQAKADAALAAVTDAEQTAADLAAAQEAVQSAQTALDELAGSEDEEAVNAAQTALQAAQEALEQLKQEIATELGIDPSEVTDELLAQLAVEAQDAADEAQAAADAAAQEAADLAAAEQAAAEAEQALDMANAELEQTKVETGLAEPAITTGGDLNVTADGLGTSGNALSTDVGGQLNVSDNGSGLGTVNVENLGDLTTSPIAADEISLAATGDIDINNDGDGADLSGNTVSVSSTGGNVGSSSDPINVDAGELNAYGQNVNAESDGSLNIGTVVAESATNLTAAGDVTDSNNGAGVVADNANIKAGGNIGSADNPLDVNADNLTTNSSGDTSLALTSPSTNVNATAGGDLSITSTGAVQGKSTSQNLDINADGDVGKPSKPYVANLGAKDGVANVVSNFGKTYVKVNKKDQQTKPSKPDNKRRESRAQRLARKPIRFDATSEAVDEPEKPGPDKRGEGGGFNWIPVAVVAAAAVLAGLIAFFFKRRRREEDDE
ncbi:MAG: hypothetical protein K6G78_00365 [bacterium]|nr:hypothetical protein [bacterium]